MYAYSTAGFEYVASMFSGRDVIRQNGINSNHERHVFAEVYDLKTKTASMPLLRHVSAASAVDNSNAARPLLNIISECIPPLSRLFKHALTLRVLRLCCQFGAFRCFGAVLVR